MPCSSKFLLWQQHHFCLFQLASSVNLLWCQVCTFHCPLRKKRHILPEDTDVHIQLHIYQKYLNLCLTLYYYAKVIVELENKHKEMLKCRNLVKLFVSNIIVDLSYNLNKQIQHKHNLKVLRLDRNKKFLEIFA